MGEIGSIVASGDARCRPPCAPQACSRCPIPLPRVYLRNFWSPDRRGGHRQRLRSRAPGWPSPAPAPRGRASAVGAARRVCVDINVVFNRYCSALLMTHLTATQRRYARSSRLARGSAGAALGQDLCDHRASRPNFARAADAAYACSTMTTATQAASALLPQPRSSAARAARAAKSWRHGVWRTSSSPRHGR